MKTWIIVIGIIVILAVVVIIRVRYELVTLQQTDYKIYSNKMQENESIRLAVISDLHTRQYGEHNRLLIEMIRKSDPDYILAVGDLVTASNRTDVTIITDLLKELTKIASVYYSPGNHEKRISIEKENFPGMDEKLKAGIEQTDAIYLENERASLNERISLYGLDMEEKFYRKWGAPAYELSDLQNDLGVPDLNRFNILMAHSPKNFPTYAAAGYDLVLSGHYHGGAIRLPGIGGVVSPQFVPFPKYSKGKYVLEKTTMIVSSGCGSHKVNLRLFNKPEVMVINIHGHII